MAKALQRITPFLWFDDKAEEAAKFYVSIFKDSRIGTITRYDEEGAKAAGRPKGSVMTVPFELDGQPFTALNGGPHFQFSGAISFVVNCDTQEEVDHFWEKLSAGGREIQCGDAEDDEDRDRPVEASLRGTERISRLDPRRPHRLVVAERHRGPRPARRRFGEAEHGRQMMEPTDRCLAHQRPALQLGGREFLRHVLE